MANRTLARFPAGTPWLVAGFLLLCGVYYVWGWSRTLGDFGGDNAYYLLIARHFSPWSAHSDVAAYFYANSLYPPLFPLVLALFGGGESLLAAHVITVTLLLLALVALYLWLRSLGRSGAESSLVTLLFALLPGTYMQALSILSENLYLLAALGCLASVSLFENTRREGWLWLAATCAAAAVLTRSAGVALLAAFVLYLIMHRPRGSWRFVLAVVFPVVLWKLMSPQQGPGYFTWLAEKYGSDPVSSLMRQLSMVIPVFKFGWIGNFTAGTAGAWLAGLVGILGFLGSIRRVFQRKLDGIYAVIYVLLVFVWPFPAEAQRLFYVIVPVLLVQCLLLLDRLPSIVLGLLRLSPHYLTLLLLFMVALPDLVLTVNRFMQPMPDHFSHFRRSNVWYGSDIAEARADVIFYRSFTGHLESLAGVVPGTDCIYSIKPSIVGYYAGRVSKVPPRPETGAAEFSDSLRESGCRYFYLVGFLSTSYPVIYYPLGRLGSAVMPVSTATGSPNPDLPAGMLVRLKEPGFSSPGLRSK